MLDGNAHGKKEAHSNSGDNFSNMYYLIYSM